MGAPKPKHAGRARTGKGDSDDDDDDDEDEADDAEDADEGADGADDAEAREYAKYFEPRADKVTLQIARWIQHSAHDAGDGGCSIAAIDFHPDGSKLATGGGGAWRARA
jgi:hypothetical protein